MWINQRVLVAAALVGCICSPDANLVRAQIPPGDITIELEPVASGLTAPLGVTHAGDGSGRLFIWEQSGQIRIVKKGQLLPVPFLDISDKLPPLGEFFDERGLLGLAFHPDYKSNGRFFVRYSAPRKGDPDEPCNDPGGFIVGCHEEILAEYRVLGNPSLSQVANPDSEIILFRVDEPQFNHDSGTVAFGPDGFLYFSLGDGGGAHDGLADDPPSHGPIGHAQNIETPLGAILRIDVDAQITICHTPPGHPGRPRTITVGRASLPAHLAHGDTIGPCTFGVRGLLAFLESVGGANSAFAFQGNLGEPPTTPYGIPPDNPFVGTDGLDEIYAYGLRNPYKFSFDDGPGGEGALFLGDVGQNLFEEVNIIVNGGNFGWVIREGLHCFDPFNPFLPPDECPDTGPLGEPLIDPIVEYSHPDSGFPPEGGITVIGGFVYRGSQSPSLVGKYVFGDFAQAFVVPSGSLYFLQEPVPGTFEIRRFIIGPDDVPYGLFLKGFGEDEDGEIYVCGSVALAPFGNTGVVERLVEVP
jgi:glucose/arabinose dehydrogenase